MSGRHAASRRKPWLRPFLAALWAALAKVGGRRTDKLSDEDKATEIWVGAIADEVNRHLGIALADQAAVGREHGPAAPARRPQVLTVARARAVAIIRAMPLDAIPWLQHGHGYEDSTGTFTAIAAAPPVLRADESISISRKDLADALAAQHLKEWGP